MVTHHNHPESLVYIMVQSWCSTFDGFRQMYNDMYPQLQYHTECFHCPKKILCAPPAYSLFYHTSHLLATTDLLTVSIVSPFFSSIQLLCHIQLFATPWTATHQASLSITNSWSLLKLIHVHRVGDGIQLPYSLSSPSPPPLGWS